MPLDDMFNSSDPQDMPSVAAPAIVDPRDQIRKLLEGSRQQQEELEKLKSAPKPTMAEPPADPTAPMAEDILRGLFSQSMPQDQRPQDNFGQLFRQSISPAKEFLANVMNGMSASFGGQKFQSVRDQAFEQYTKEQELSQRRDALRQQAMQQIGTLAQQVHREKLDDQYKRSLELARLSDSDAQRQVSIQKAIGDGQRLGVTAATTLANLDQKDKEAKVKADETAAKGQFTDKFQHSAELSTQALYKKAGIDWKDPKNNADYMQRVEEHARMLRLQDLQDQAANKPEKEGKTATPQLVYVPDGQGGYNVQQVGPGTAVPPGAVSQAGMSSANTPTSQTRSAGEQGEIIGHAGNELVADILENKKLLGNFSDYWKKAMNGSPMADPTLSRIMSEFSSFAALQPKLHGFRGSEAMREFTKIIGGIPQNPEAAVQAIRGIQKTAKVVQDVGHPNASKTATVTHRFNPATGKTEEVK